MRKSNDNVNHSGEEVNPPGRHHGERHGDDDVLELIHTVMHQYRSLQYRALRDGPHEITHMDSKVLGYFGRHPGATQSELAEHSGRDKAQLARLIKGLRDRGLLDGVPDENDRRNTRLTLTEAGKALQRSLYRQAKRVSRSAVTGLSEKEEAQLKELLRRVSNNLTQP